MGNRLLRSSALSAFTRTGSRAGPQHGAHIVSSLRMRDDTTRQVTTKPGRATRFATPRFETCVGGEHHVRDSSEHSSVLSFSVPLHVKITEDQAQQSRR